MMTYSSRGLPWDKPLVLGRDDVVECGWQVSNLQPFLMMTFACFGFCLGGQNVVRQRQRGF